MNLAPYSFFNGFNYMPPIIGFSSVGFKDTVRNIQETGEFVWNLAIRSLAESMNSSSASVPPEVNEFELSGLTPVQSLIVNAPRVGESPVSFECRMTQSIQLQNKQGDMLGSWLTLGEVVAVHILKSLLIDGIYLTAAAHPILRGGGPADYFEITDNNRFEMHRPKSTSA